MLGTAMGCGQFGSGRGPSPLRLLLLHSLRRSATLTAMRGICDGILEPVDRAVYTRWARRRPALAGDGARQGQAAGKGTGNLQCTVDGVRNAPRSAGPGALQSSAGPLLTRS